MAPIIKEAKVKTSEEVDVVKSFKKVYERPQLVMDFSRETNRYLNFHLNVLKSE